MVKDDSTALSLYEAGKLDFLSDISTLDLKRLSGDPELHVYPYLKTEYLGFAVTKYPMTNPRIRRAIAMAIDKTKLGELLPRAPDGGDELCAAQDDVLFGQGRSAV